MATEPKRFREPDALQWRDPVYVVCPRCRTRATINAMGRGSARMLCPSCTLTREWSNDRLHVVVEGREVALQRDHGAWLNPESGRYQREFETPEGIDARFGLRLWLRTECCGGHLLWANNAEHLAYLASYVGSTLRERPDGPATLAWYLPRWMKAAKHRDEILTAIGRMQASLTQE